MNAAIEKHWEPVSVDLTYRVGEVSLFSITLVGFANRTHFTAVPPYLDAPIPEAEGAPDGDFIFFPSYPISFKPEVVHRSKEWLIYTPYTFNNYFVDLKGVGTFDDYLRQFSSKSRATLLRKVRKFEQLSGGKIEWRECRTADEVGEFLELALPLSARTYQARLLGCGLPESGEFFRQAQARASAGQVRAFLLFLEGNSIAYVFCFCSEGVVTYDYVGFDERKAGLSPGTVLQYLIFQSLFCDEACAIFDFTEGESAQKRFFSTSSRLCGKSYYLKRSISNEIVVGAHRALNSFVTGAVSVLERLGLKAALRRLIRRAA